MSVARQLVIPLYLFLCLLLGGSAQGIWAKMLLQLIGVGIITWALAERPAEKISPAARQMLWLGGAAIALVLLYLVPLPPAVWTELGGREAFAEGFRILGIPLPAMPVSLAPYRSIDALLSAIPPLAVFVGIVRLKAFRPVYAASAIIAGTIANIGLSALQVSTAGGGSTSWYLYPVTNFGYGVGFFANANHMATLLLVSLPFIAALLPAARGSHIQRYSAFVAIISGLALLILIGIALNGSLAGYALVVPVALGSLIIVLGRNRRWTLALALSSAILLIVAIGAIASSDIGRDRFGAEAEQSTKSRAELLEPTMEIAREAFPTGTGLGTFRQVFAMHEDPDRVIRTYSNHAHNDYAEWLMELGLPGLVLMILFLAWWARVTIGIWSDAQASAFARAASIASAAVLAHSLVDFPLRTSAIAASFAFCIALLADRRSPQIAKSGELRPTRHLIIG
jgi:O-antigen ligase